MRLKLGQATEKAAFLHCDDGEIIMVTCPDARMVAQSIARAINRDRHFEALVAALTPFRSTEMGGQLVDMIDQREHRGELAQARLIQLVSMIDVILDACEKEHDGDTAPDA